MLKVFGCAIVAMFKCSLFISVVEERADSLLLYQLMESLNSLEVKISEFSKSNYWIFLKLFRKIISSPVPNHLSLRLRGELIG